MSDRDGFRPGVPCWVAAVEPEPTEVLPFYSELFGWEIESLMPEEAPGDFFLCRHRGRDAAGIVSYHGAPAPPAAVWSTHMWVDSADDTVTRVLEAGGSVIGEPFDSPGGGRVAVLSDPSGAVFCTWEPQTRNGAQVVNEPSAWAMSVLQTDDPDAAARFYGSVFGWQAEPIEMGAPGMRLCRLPGFIGGEAQQPVPRDVVAVMATAGGEGPTSAGSRWAVDFWVDDAEVVASRAGELGGKVISSPQDVPGFRQAVLADPQGAIFSISQLMF